MKLSRKILKFTEPLTYRRGWRRAQRSIFRMPLKPMLAQIDWDRAREIKKRYANSAAGYAKYADIEPWLILKNLGHSGIGLDIDRSPLFGELLELFGVRRVVYKIDAFEPLPDLGQQFDWITAFSTNFYLYHPAKKHWGTAEWDFFLRDLQHHLAPGGKIFFGLNPSYNGGYYTPEIRDLFLNRGADVERERIFFENGLRF